MTRITGFNRTIFITLLVFFVVTLLGGALGLIWLDGPIAERLSQYQHNWRDHWLVLGFRQLGKGWTVVWLLMLWVAHTKRSRQALIAILALLLTSSLVLPLKGLTDRSRPGDVFRPASTETSSVASVRGDSFPSGDTSTVIAVSVALAGLIHWQWSLVVSMLAFGIAMSRVLILTHYLSDVCAGAAIGLLSGLAARYLDERIAPVCSVWLDRRLSLVYALLLFIPIVTWWTEGFPPVQAFFLPLGLPILAWAFIVKKTRHPQPVTNN